MADTSNRGGLGSNKVSEKKKDEIRSKGGQTTGAKNLSTEDRKRGGQNSHSGGNS